MAAEALREAFLDLAALKAMPAGGPVHLPIHHRGRLRRGPGRGSSMSEETRRRVFEPFFTTKGDQGNGLGLAVVGGTVTLPPGPSCPAGRGQPRDPPVAGQPPPGGGCQVIEAADGLTAPGSRWSRSTWS